MGLEDVVPEPIELCKRGTDEVVAYACGKCGAVSGSVRTHGECAREMAARHCGPWKCLVCGCDHDFSYQTICRKCLYAEQAAESAAKEQAAFDKAEKVPFTEYDGPVTNGDKYWSSVEEAVEDLEDDLADGEELSEEFLWACHVTPLRFDADDWVNQELEDHYDGAGDNISGADMARLQKLLDDWCAGVGIESWSQDQTRVVLL